MTRNGNINIRSFQTSPFKSLRITYTLKTYTEVPADRNTFMFIDSKVVSHFSEYNIKTTRKREKESKNPQSQWLNRSSHEMIARLHFDSCLIQINYIKYILFICIACFGWLERECMSGNVWLSKTENQCDCSFSSHAHWWCQSERPNIEQ